MEEDPEEKEEEVEVITLLVVISTELVYGFSFFFPFRVKFSI
jgi:hypothetical protein